MTTYENRLWVWSESAVQELLKDLGTFEPAPPGYCRFALDDPGLHVDAGPRLAHETPDFNCDIAIDFKLAQTDPVEQARQQAAFFVPILVRDDVTSAALHHNDYWLVLTKHEGKFALTTSEWICDYDITKAIRKQLQDRDIAWSNEDFGEDTGWHVPWDQPAR